ncbi:MAG: nucleotidyltransferase domain-containing protein [Rhodocyclales bacterium]|nr:nucleotidyltransferase domain-containing protein [Rhodocyclales bacterium]
MTTVAPTVGFANALFGKARRGVLALMFGHPGEARYTREIVKRIGAGASQVQKELELLTAAGLLLREERANQVYYRANPAAAIYPELVGLVSKSFGVADVLRELLETFGARIAYACIYGSVARGEQRADSDIDLLIVGSLRLSELALPLQSAEARLGYRISPVLTDESEFRRRQASGETFLRRVLAEDPIFLIGEPPVAKVSKRIRAR